MNDPEPFRRDGAPAAWAAICCILVFVVVIILLTRSIIVLMIMLGLILFTGAVLRAIEVGKP